MFGRIIITQFKNSIRSKTYMGWVLAFPLFLGTLFSFAFSSIYENNKSQPIKIVIEAEDEAIYEYKVMQAYANLDKDSLRGDLEQYYVDEATAEAMGETFNEEKPISDDDLDELESVESFEDMRNYNLDVFPYDYLTIDKSEIDEIDTDDHPFTKVLRDLEYDDGTKMVEEVEVTSHEEAEKLLEDEEIDGIITIAGMRDIYLEVGEMGVSHSILSSIISEYRVQVDKAINTINEDPDELDKSDEVMDESTSSLEFVEAKGLAGDNKDPFVTYFYNLIAMLCIMGSVSSLHTIVNNQANQSTTGIRIDSSPVNKIPYELAQLFAVYVIQTIVAMIALTYYIFVLGIKFGGDLPVIYLTTAIAALVGIAQGYMVAHIGKMAVEKKEALLMVILLGGGFLSGLMYGDMKILIEQKFPLFNRINPSAVITDAFYAINVFGVGERYYNSLIYIVGLSIVMILIGIILSRKSSYKSL